MHKSQSTNRYAKSGKLLSVTCFTSIIAALGVRCLFQYPSFPSKGRAANFQVHADVLAHEAMPPHADTPHAAPHYYPAPLRFTDGEAGQADLPIIRRPPTVVVLNIPVGMDEFAHQTINDTSVAQHDWRTQDKGIEGFTDAVDSDRTGGSPEALLSETALETLSLTATAGTVRFAPTTRPAIPEAQHPTLSTASNTDTNKSPTEWQRATDDWRGARPWLEDRGLSFNASFMLEVARAPVGAMSGGRTNGANIFDANLTVDTAKLLHLEGGTFFVNFQNEVGSTLSLDGAVQEASDVTTEGRTQISELWYEQRLAGGKLRVKGGKIDANTEFSHIEFSEHFLNGSMAYSPTILGLPSHPDPAMGLILGVQPTDHFYGQVGVFDGSTFAGRPTGAHAVTLFSGLPNVFLIGEAGATWTDADRHDGKFAIGVWHITGTIPRFDGGDRSGATGPYCFVEQTLWRPNPADRDDERGIALFLQYGWAEPSYSLVQEHIGGGLSWTGPVPSRASDVFGFGASYARLGRNPEFLHGQELVTELFYRLRATKFFSIQPDLQYIHDPSQSLRSDCLAATLQFIIDF
jgi:porin